MSGKDWMGERTVSDVSTAIQSQTIQTALEQNTSKITDAGFASFLQNAPIPRMFRYTTVTTTINAGTETVIDFNTAAANTHDPYTMFAGGSTFRFPIDGYYTVTLNTGIVGNTVAASVYAAIKTVNSVLYGAGAYIAIQGYNTNAASANNWMNLSSLRPWNAGDTIACYVGNQTATNQATLQIAAATNTLGIVWNAPFNQYTAGAGGN